MDNNSNKVFSAVVAFGMLMLLVATLLISTRPATAVDVYLPQSADALQGRWDTRALAEDNLNGAYSGQIEFGPDFYTIGNDIVATPIRIDGVSYRLEGNQVLIAVAGNDATVQVQMLSHNRATIDFGDSSTTLYMYRR